MSVYIVSWILMTLAINDTRISVSFSANNDRLMSVDSNGSVSESIGLIKEQTLTTV